MAPMSDDKILILLEVKTVPETAPQTNFISLVEIKLIEIELPIEVHGMSLVIKI